MLYVAEELSNPKKFISIVNICWDRFKVIGSFKKLQQWGYENQFRKIIGFSEMFRQFFTP